MKRAEGMCELGRRGRNCGEVVRGGDERLMGARGEFLEVEVDRVGCSRERGGFCIDNGGERERRESGKVGC